MKLGNSTSTAQSKSTMLIVFRAGSRVLKKLASIALVLLDPKGHRALQVSNKSDKSDTNIWIIIQWIACLTTFHRPQRQAGKDADNFERWTRRGKKRKPLRRSWGAKRAQDLCTWTPDGTLVLATVNKNQFNYSLLGRRYQRKKRLLILCRKILFVMIESPRNGLLLWNY